MANLLRWTMGLLVVGMLVQRTTVAGLGQDEVDALVDAARSALAEGAGIALPEAVPVLLLSADEASARRARWAREQGREDALLTGAVDAMAELVFSRTMLGRYLPDEKVIYVIADVVAESAGRGGVEEILFPVLAHELVHAYDDQVYRVVPKPSDLVDVLRRPEGLAELQTRMSLLEGRATWASELACRAAGRKPLPVLSLEEARRAELLDGDGSWVGETLAGVGNQVARLKLVQYAQGREFARSAWAFGGEPFFEQVFAHLPLRAEELEDFGRFRLRWADELERREEEGAPASEPACRPADASESGR